MALAFDISTVSGISEKEAAERLKAEGFNELPSSRSRGVFVIALSVISEPMFLMLFACGLIYLVLGDLQEAAMLLFFVFVIMGITLFEERKTERTLEALRDLSSPRAEVIRGGIKKRIAGRDVVRGDIILLSEGDRVPADAAILHNSNLKVDESLLTGESVAVEKSVWDGFSKIERPGGEKLPYLYSGTMVVSGVGAAQVVSIGLNSEIGRIGKALSSIDVEHTPVQKEIRRLVRNFAAAGVILCTVVVFAYVITRGDWFHGFLAGIAMAMAMLPEEFPVVLTIFFAMGAWRISKQNVLTRKIPAVETLGSTTVLCSDKTGTITLNQMSVQLLSVGSDFFSVTEKLDIPEKFHELVEFGILASQKDPFDPMEKAIRDLGHKRLNHTEHLHHDWQLVREYPLSGDLLALSHVWKSPDGEEFIIAAKGAPEAVADLCHFTEKQKHELNKEIEEMAKKGLRVIGAAKSSFSKSHLPEIQHEFAFEFIGLIGLADPVREKVPPSIAECYSAGIRVIMITGDYPATAQNIASQIGLKSPEKVLTGAELGKMSDRELKEKIGEVNIFARILPEQKLRIVMALKANNEIVAMTGDGVNDAPALKSAHIGVAMGGRGCDVAREAAALVLLDDDFSSIVRAVRLGRRIFFNLRKALTYIFAVHVPIAGMALIPVLLKLPLVLLPVHIVFLELIIDSACSMVFEEEGEEKNIMQKPPRNTRDALFGRKAVTLSLLQGLVLLFLVLVSFIFLCLSGYPEGYIRSITFTMLVLGNLGLIFINRVWGKPSRALWWVMGGVFVSLILINCLPVLRELFRFS